MSRTPKPFDKYKYYQRSVQSTEGDVQFFRDTYRELKNKNPKIMREDFCGTFGLACEWVKLNPQFKAIGIDLDSEPLDYGRTHYLPKLREDQQKRITLYQKNVLAKGFPLTDISVAMNFSYFIFKTRPEMKSYFSNVLRGLKKDGIFIMDLFGGSLCHEENEESTKFSGFTYFWDQASFDPIRNHAVFYIHFKVKGEKKRERVFTYDWRMWSIPELREILAEVGFKKTHIYWEGTNRSGGGNGVFKRTEIGESCQSWIAYIVAER